MFAALGLLDLRCLLYFAEVSGDLKAPRSSRFVTLVCLHVQNEVCTVSKGLADLNYNLPPSLSFGAGCWAQRLWARRPPTFLL